MKIILVKMCFQRVFFLKKIKVKRRKKVWRHCVVVITNVQFYSLKPELKFEFYIFELV